MYSRRPVLSVEVGYIHCYSTVYYTNGQMSRHLILSDSFTSFNKFQNMYTTKTYVYDLRCMVNVEINIVYNAHLNVNPEGPLKRTQGILME